MLTDRWVPVLLLVAVVTLAWVGMAAGWRRRRARQADLPEPPSPPQDLASGLVSVDGLYVGSVLRGDWLDRVVPHGLGARANATLHVYPAGLVLERDGSAAVWIPAGDLQEVRRDTGLAGKVTETGGLVVWAWRLGEHELESGLRPRYAQDAPRLVDALTRLRPEVG